MPVWAWVVVAATALLAVPLVVALAIARIMGVIADDVTELLEQERWSAAPLTRSLDEPAKTLAAVGRSGVTHRD